MMASKMYAAATYAQKAWLPYMYCGVIFRKKEAFFAELFEETRLTGSRIPHPTTVKQAKMFRNILVNRMNMAPSSPTLLTMSCSFVRTRGGIQPKRPLLIGGGACLVSACFALGA